MNTKSPTTNRSRSGRPSGSPTANSQGTPPAALTIVTGGDQFLMSRAVHRVLAAILAAQPEADVHRLDTSDPGAAGLLPESLSPSLFNPVAVGVLTGLEQASENTIGVLLALLADLGDNRVVAVHAGTKGRRSLDQLRSLNLAGGVAVIDCPPVKKGRALRDFLLAEAATAGRRLSPDAAEALMTSLGGDVMLLVGALEQLLSDFPDDPVGTADVATMFTGVAEVSGFQFSDALWDRHPNVALGHLRWGAASSSLSAPAATGAAAAGLRALVRVASAPKGMSDMDVARLAGVPQFKVRLLRSQAERWRPEDLAAALVGLARADGAVKGGLRPGENLEPVQKSHHLEGWVRSTGRH